MALQSFTWNNGTNENPVPLNAQQLSNLVRLATTENIAKDVRGHITTTSGIISRYDKYVLNQAFQNLTVHATEQSDSFALAASRTTINEGETSTIIVTGMATSSVDFAIEHTVTGRNGIEENAVKAKMHMDGNILVVDAPQENASWQDVVRVKAKPIYEDWSNSSAIRYVDITVKAVALSGVSLIGNSTIPVGNTEEISVNLTPSNCTKSSGVSFSNTLVSDGSLPVMQPLVSNGKIYITAPAEECGLTLTTNVHLFGDENTIAFYTTKEFEVLFPNIRFVITTDGTFSDISTANPKITLKRTVRPDGSAVSSADQELAENKYVLTGVVSGSSLIYTVGDGNIAANNVETFSVAIENVRGYSISIINTVKPSSTTTTISAIYNVRQSGIGIIYTDGTEETYDSIMNRGSLISDKTPIGIRIQSSLYNFVIPLETAYEYLDNMMADGATNKSIPITGWDMDITILPCSQSRYNFNAEWNDLEQDSDVIPICRTYRIANGSKDASLKIIDPFFLADAATITIAGVTYNGYCPHPAQIAKIISNSSKINVLLGLADKEQFLDGYIAFFTYYTTDMNGARRLTFTNKTKSSDEPNLAANSQKSWNNVQYRCIGRNASNYNNPRPSLLPIYIID